MTGSPEVLAVERTAETVRVNLRIPPELDCLPHHFPRLPIVPGVVQLAWAVTYGSQFLPVRGAFQRVAGLKFQYPMLPRDRVDLSLSLTATGELAFSYKSEQHAYSSGRVVFG